MIKVKLTRDQISALSRLNDKATKAWKHGRPGAIFGQLAVHDGYMLCRFMSHEEVIRWREAAGMSTATDAEI